MKKHWFAAVIVLGVAVTVPLQSHAAMELLQQLENAFIEVGEKIRPCVVNIDVKSAVPEGFSEDGQIPEDIFRFFNIPSPRERMPRPMPRREASGSGFIFSKDGCIVTNNHVVEEAASIEVRFWNNRVLDATIVGRDPQTDLAVIKVEADFDLPTAVLGDSDVLKVGQFSVAAGSPRGLEGSLSFGHITALGREGLNLGLRFQNLIQTDAAINLGNSGGPLCNIDGEVIGINVAIVYGAESLGFAIPVNAAKKIIPILISDGRVTRGYLGVFIDAATDYAAALGLPDSKGAFVIDVSEDTPAARAGIKPDDVVRKVNGQVVENDQDLKVRISDIVPGEIAKLEIWRDGAPIELDVKLEEFPESSQLVTQPPAEDILGLRTQPLTDQMRERLGLDGDLAGVVVSEVKASSPADKAGIRVGDIVVRIGKYAVRNMDDFKRLMKEQAQPGGSVLIRLFRGEEIPTVAVLKVPNDYVPEP
ncbi:MAG TPA: trypsin-like peptidase domain-containing protein [Candidatus Hydrogenedentes bacterium]|jgi:serine protease Do|nr:trypsin-like peptidase domain-containing protein [Candidatus Hydrogenedentota bacterium]HPK00246.1 trypsin-like peptidase domain-containing protein [Candidatus Hydrogenedentota bacterium]